jgi:hypothetical protein
MDDEEIQSPVMQNQENIESESLHLKEESDNEVGIELSINEDIGDRDDFFSIQMNLMRKD